MSRRCPAPPPSSVCVHSEPFHPALVPIPQFFHIMANPFWSTTITHGIPAPNHPAGNDIDFHTLQPPPGEVFTTAEITYSVTAGGSPITGKRLVGIGSAAIVAQPATGAEGPQTVEVRWTHKRGCALSYTVKAYAQPRPLRHWELYGLLRQSILARHFALGRFWRTNHFDVSTELGAWHPEAWQQFHREQNAAAAPTYSWEYVMHEANPDRWGYPPTYSGVRDFPAETYPAETELWRIMRHDRSNPLLWTGVRLMGLCAEHHLGHREATKIILLILDTLESLFKFSSPRDDQAFDGYILRWDPVTSDNWTRQVDALENEDGRLVSGRETPIMPCEFLLSASEKDFDTTGKRYLYCTPLWDPRYQLDVSTRDGDRGRFRRWEPSMEEFLGLMVGYSHLHRTFGQPTSSPAREILRRVRQHVDRIARYLHHCGYVLVRPGGGFPFNGAAETNSAVEHPMACAFRAILGEQAPAGPSRSWRSALDLAHVQPGRPDLDPGALTASALERLSSCAAVLAELPVLGPLAGAPEIRHALRSREVLADLDYLATAVGLEIQDGWKSEAQWLTEQFENLFPSGDDQEKQAANRQRALRARAGLGRWGVLVDGGIRTELVAALLTKTLEPRLRWQVTARTGAINPTFMVLCGLLTVDDPAGTVGGEYLRWYRREVLPLDRTAGPRAGDDQSGEVTDENTKPRSALATVVAASVSAGPPEQNVLLTRLRRELDNLRSEYAALGNRLWKKDYADDDTEQAAFTEEASDCRGNGWGYLAAMSRAWLLQMDPIRGSVAVTGEPSPTPAEVAKWPHPVLPGHVIGSVRSGELHLPLDALKEGFVPSPDWSTDVDLLERPPARLRDDQCGRPPRPRDLPPIEIELRVAYSPAKWGRYAEERVFLPPAPDGWIAVVSRVETLLDSRNLSSDSPILEPGNGYVTVRIRCAPPGLGNPRLAGILKARLHLGFVVAQ